LAKKTLVLRILRTVVITLAVVALSVYWVFPVAFSLYTARRAGPVVRVAPTDLRDPTVSQAPGRTLSYLGYRLEVPWSDYDETRTKAYKHKAVELRFRSGLVLAVTAIPSREWAAGLADIKMSPQTIESAFGHEAMRSDYDFLKHLYEFTPEKMNLWALSPGKHYRDAALLLLKAVALSHSAESGVFNVQNQALRGFQQGDPKVRPDRILISLYSDEGGVELILAQRDYRNSAGVTQPEINRIVQTLRRVPPE